MNKKDREQHDEIMRRYYEQQAAQRQTMRDQHDAASRLQRHKDSVADTKRTGQQKPDEFQQLFNGLNDRVNNMTESEYKAAVNNAQKKAGSFLSKAKLTSAQKREVNETAKKLRKKNGK